LGIPFFSSTGEEWRMKKLLVRRFYCKASVFHLGSLLSPLEHKFLTLADSRVIPVLHSPFSTGHNRGVTLSPWRSYPIGSSFFSFSILHSLRRCDKPYSVRMVDPNIDSAKE
jgi:hypothetical protein